LDNIKMAKSYLRQAEERFSANSLHQNFYENWLPEETIKDGMENVRKFVKRIKELINVGG